jgi:hypothetical protein
MAHGAIGPLESLLGAELLGELRVDRRYTYIGTHPTQVDVTRLHSPLLHRSNVPSIGTGLERQARMKFRSTLLVASSMLRWKRPSLKVCTVLLYSVGL